MAVGHILCTLLSNQQRRALPAFLKLGWAGSFWKSTPERDPFDASYAVVCASRDRGDPDAREELQRVHVPDAAYSLAPSSPSPAINSPCEEGCCSRDYEQGATRHAALRCLLRVTADDIRQ